MSNARRCTTAIIDFVAEAADGDDEVINCALLAVINHELVDAPFHDQSLAGLVEFDVRGVSERQEAVGGGNLQAMAPRVVQDGLLVLGFHEVGGSFVEGQQVVFVS